MTSDPKEALERLKRIRPFTAAGENVPQAALVSYDDLRTLIAEREGLEREVARQKHENDRLHEVIADIVSTDAGNRADLETAEAKLSALQEAALSRSLLQHDLSLAPGIPDSWKLMNNGGPTVSTYGDLREVVGAR